MPKPTPKEIAEELSGFIKDIKDGVSIYDVLDDLELKVTDWLAEYDSGDDEDGFDNDSE